jgi:DNA-binding CsgD family transcriptional regulator
MDDTESSVKRNIKRNIALSSKRDASHPKENSLSDREKSVVREIALGRTNKEIADNLFISAHTVITHRKNITRKLGVKTVSGLTVYAILNKLIQMEEM